MPKKPLKLRVAAGRFIMVVKFIDRFSKNRHNINVNTRHSKEVTCDSFRCNSFRNFKFHFYSDTDFRENIRFYWNFNLYLFIHNILIYTGNQNEV